MCHKKLEDIRTVFCSLIVTPIAAMATPVLCIVCALLGSVCVVKKGIEYVSYNFL